MSPEQVGSGVIEGGWNYVALAYGMSWTVFIGYTVSLWWRGQRGGSS
jgi:hypothetical protein